MKNKIVKIVDFRKEIKSHLLSVVDDKVNIWIQRPEGKDVIVVSKETFDEMQNTINRIKEIV